MEQKGGKEHESNKTHGGERDMKQSFEEHSERNSWHLIPGCLNFWRRNDVFLILAHPVYKMWLKQEPNTLELWNKLHFEEKKTESIYRV